MTGRFHWTRWEFDRFGIKLRTHWGSESPWPGEDEWTAYQTVLAIGRYRVHCFHRGDADLHTHDHMWDFVTFPLTSYVEEVWNPRLGKTEKRIVFSGHFHNRPAEYSHRLLGKWHRGQPDGLAIKKGRIWTLVKVGEKRREWGFWIPFRNIVWRDEQNRKDIHESIPSRWIPWKDYIYKKVR